MSNSQAKNILLISTEGWGKSFVSKHHYANYLSKKNNVFFLNTVSSSKTNPAGSIELSTEELNENLTLVSYKNLLPRLNSLPRFLQKKIYKRQAEQIHKELGIESFDIVWSFDPYRFWNLNWFNTQKRIYHTVDYHPDAKFEKECCDSADVILAVTDLIQKDLPQTSTPSYLVRHAADIDGFSAVNDVQIPGTQSIKAFYVGNFHKDIDYHTLESLVSENQDVDFVMIGPTLDSNLSSGYQIEESTKKKLESFNNLHFLGSVPPGELMSYLDKSDINLVLFRKERQRIHCSPHKMMGYFYSGSITLSNYIDDHKETDSDILIMKEEMPDLVRTFQELKSDLNKWNSEELKSKRKNYALANSYDVRLNEIFEIIGDA